MNDYSEKRLAKRMSDSFIVTYQLRSPHEAVLQIGSGEYDGVALDVSETGVGIDSGQEIPVGAHVQLKFCILNEGAVSERNRRREILLSGESRYCRRTEKSNYRIGILFKNLPDADRAFLANYIQDQTIAQWMSLNK